MTALAAAMAVLALWLAYGWPAAAVAVVGIAATFIATITASQKEQQIMAETASETDPGVLRRRAARLAQLGIILSCEPVEDVPNPRGYTVVTAGGDVVDVARREMPSYLSGLAHGHHAAQAAGA